MKNKGQTTILFSLVISALLIFTLVALEAGRIYMSRVKIKSVVHSTHTSIMADYNSELFERYHLLFMDPTYGTGSEAAAEEKIKDYLEISLNGEDGTGSCGYQFSVEEISLADCKNILDEEMEQLKNQITEYEKTAGYINRVKELEEKIKNQNADIEDAAKETEINGMEREAEATEETEGSSVQEETDPRDELKEALKFGTLSFILPGDSGISKEEYDFWDAPSKDYEKEQEENRDNGFQDIDFLKKLLNKSAKESEYGNLAKRAAFVDYVRSNFSNGVNQRQESVLKCEAEYILKGKSNDYDNLEAVVDEIVWMRMPVNYAYLLTDTTKKSEALTMATAICMATGTAPLTAVVKYLLLGCWAYGETLSEMKSLLAGEEIAIIKTAETWNTDLKSLCSAGKSKKVTHGLGYEEYIMLLLAKKGDGKLNACYARMLDVIEKNLQKTDEDFKFSNCVGEMTIQGKIVVNSLFISGKEKENYEYYFEEKIAY